MQFNNNNYKRFFKQQNHSKYFEILWIEEKQQNILHLN
jgi:hypothetical protein